MRGDGPHKCDDGCVCPIHGTALFYNRLHNEHACQDPDCEYAHGLEEALWQEAKERYTR